LFLFDSNGLKREWKTARIKSKVSLKVKDLRDWFCSEMGSLGIPDRYVDAFCGKTPKSVLARHYTDYTPRKLKEIYDKAGLVVISYFSY
jgi:intergrase/recombinase